MAVPTLGSSTLVPSECQWSGAQRGSVFPKQPSPPASSFSVGLLLTSFLSGSHFFLTMLHHFFKKENHEWHLWISLLRNVFYGLSNKNWFNDDGICLVLFCFPALIHIFTCVHILLLRWMIRSPSKERGRGRDLLKNIWYSKIWISKTQTKITESYKIFMEFSEIMNSPRTLSM